MNFIIVIQYKKYSLIYIFIFLCIYLLKISLKHFPLFVYCYIYILAEGPGVARGITKIGKKIAKKNFEKKFDFFQPITPPGHP